MRKLFISLTIILLLTAYCGNVLALELGFCFPELNTKRGKYLTKKHAEELNIKAIRTYIVWKQLEKTKGHFDWEKLDRKITFAKDNGFSFMLTIHTDGPEWVCGKRSARSCLFTDTGAFENFMTALLKRYSNKIDKIQFGNEWPSRFWYPGEKEDYVMFNNIMYDLVQEYSPNTQIVLGGFSIGQLRVLSACEEKISSVYLETSRKYYGPDDIKSLCSGEKGQDSISRMKYAIKEAKYDIMDIHLYDDPENWHIYYDVVRTLVPADKDIIVSEFGGPNVDTEPYTEEYHAKKMKEYLDAISKLDVTEAYIFKLQEPGEKKYANKPHRKTGLVDMQPKIRIKPAYYVFKEFSDNCCR